MTNTFLNENLSNDTNVKCSTFLHQNTTKNLIFQKCFQISKYSIDFYLHILETFPNDFGPIDQFLPFSETQF